MTEQYKNCSNVLSISGTCLAALGPRSGSPGLPSDLQDPSRTPPSNSRQVTEKLTDKSSRFCKKYTGAPAVKRIDISKDVSQQAVREKFSDPIYPFQKNRFACCDQGDRFLLKLRVVGIFKTDVRWKWAKTKPLFMFGNPD